MIHTGRRKYKLETLVCVFVCEEADEREKQRNMSLHVRQCVGVRGFVCVVVLRSGTQAEE